MKHQNIVIKNNSNSKKPIVEVKNALLEVLVNRPIYLVVWDFHLLVNTSHVHSRQTQGAKHAVVLAGYNPQVDSFLIRNSWGETNELWIDATSLIGHLESAHFLIMK